MTSMLLAAIEQAAAIDPPQGSTYLDAEHVVILMQENRSFDHTLGTLRGVRGYNDPRAVTLPDQKPVWMQTNAAGETYAPFRFDIQNTKITWLGSLPHGWTDQSDSRNGGNHDKWLDAKRSGRAECRSMPLTLGYYTREDIPFYYALADAFTVCDHNFCSSLTGTTPNRLYLWTGTIREKQEFASVANVRNSEVNYTHTARWTTFPERLEDAGITWRIYQNELSLPTGFDDETDSWLANFTDNPIEWFDQYHVGFLPTYQRELRRAEKELPGEIEATQKALAEAAEGTPLHVRLTRELRQKREWLARIPGEIAKWSPEAYAKLTPRERALHAKAFTTNTGDPHYREVTRHRYTDNGTPREMEMPKGDVLHQFRQDVENGKLPAVSWIVSPEKFSDHAGSPWYGSWYLAEVMNILTKNPEVWRKTIFVLTYDENDGYFDHLPPFVAPDPTRPETGKVSPGIDASVEYVSLEQDLARKPAAEARGGPIGLGFRVPMIVASPWSRGGHVCSQTFDHTSVLQLLEKVLSHRTGKPVKEPNISAWRRAVCGDMSSAFRPFTGKGGDSLPNLARDAFFEGIHKAQFKGMPTGYKRLGEAEAAQYKQNRYGAPWMPQQEPGVRPSTPLPYELSAAGMLSADRQSLEITLEARKRLFGEKASGSGFHVYTPGAYAGGSEKRARAYAAAPGEAVRDAWPLAGFANGVYELRVCGPNGFYRELRGSAKDPAVTIACDYPSRDGAPTGAIALRVTNHHAAAAYTVSIHDHGYGTGRHTLTVEPGATRAVTLDLRASFHWYDASVTVEGAPDFERRFAGRSETGAMGISDPIMGRAEHLLRGRSA